MSLEGGLTPKQEAFVRAYMETGNATEAYRRSYDTAKMKAPSINREAKALIDNPKIAARLQVLQERAAVTAVLSRAWIIERLMRNVDKALELEDVAGSNKALELLGKTDEMRLFLERSESDNRHHHSAEPLSPFADHLADMLGHGAEGQAEKPLPN